MNRGFVIVAQNNSTIDYIKCAEVLCKNIKTLMPNESVSLITDIFYTSELFDNVITFPYGDTCKNIEWKLNNDWQVYDASPYEYTIKIESDIYLPRKIDYWWDILRHRDLVISTSIRNFKNEIVTDSFYRKIFIENKLPNVYNALTYFKRSETADIFFQTVRDIFENWESYRKELKCDIKEKATTDVVYAIASLIVGIDKTTMPEFTSMSMIHMKKFINNLYSENWENELLIELSKDCFRLDTIPQLYPFHYHKKEFAKTIESELNEGN
jgi:hypothetical protein